MWVVRIHRNFPVVQSFYKGNNWYRGWVPPSTPTYTHAHTRLILKYWWPLSVALWLDKRILLPKPLIARCNQTENFFYQNIATKQDCIYEGCKLKIAWDNKSQFCRQSFLIIVLYILPYYTWTISIAYSLKFLAKFRKWFTFFRRRCEPIPYQTCFKMHWVCTEIGRTCWRKPQLRSTAYRIGYIFKNEIELHKWWTVICVICAVHKARSLYKFLSDFFLKKTFMAPLWIMFSYLKTADSLPGDSWLSTTKFPGDLPTHLIISISMKGWVNHGATRLFWTQIPGIGVQFPNY